MNVCKEKDYKHTSALEKSKCLSVATRMRLKYPFHPLLFALYPVLALYAHNVDQTPFSSFLPPAILFVLIAGGATRGIARHPGGRERTGLVVSTIVLLFFTYGHAHRILLDLLSHAFLQRADFKAINWFARNELILHVPLLACFIFSGTWAARRIARVDKLPADLTRTLNVAAAVLIAMPLLQIGAYVLKAARTETVRETVEGNTTTVTGEKRDIYYIILDGYARADILREFYGYDNSEFVSRLRAKGFFIADRARANYGWTFLSLPSSLNYRYLDELAERMGKKSNDLRIPYRMIRDNHAARFLKARGYRFVHFNSTWGATMHNRHADLEVGYRRGLFADEFQRILAETTLLKVASSFIVEDLAAFHLHAFEKLRAISALPGPTFTFAHIILPHHPYLFDRGGNVKRHASMLDQFQNDMWQYGDAYLDQLVFVNKKVLEVIDAILSAEGPAPIIILQSDHGPQLFNARRDDYIRARMANLNAYLLPEGVDAALYPSITPVNTFRVIFNRYFDAGLPVLPDRVQFSTMNRPYDLLEIGPDGRPVR